MHKSLALRVVWLHSSSVVHACHVVLFERSTSKGEENQSALLKRAGIAASRCFFVFVLRALLICLMSTCQLVSLHRKPIPDPVNPLPPPAVPLLRPPLSPLLGGDNTPLICSNARYTVPVWPHPVRPGRNILAPYGALPAGVMNPGQLVGVCGRAS